MTTLEQLRELDPSVQDMGSYWLSAEQRNEAWFKLRAHRLTASTFHRARNLEPWCDIDQLIKDLRTGSSSTKTNAAMEHGVAMEPHARNKYMETYSCEVREVGLAIPKWNPDIGASSDGFIGDDGCIEIKCPKNIYPALVVQVQEPRITPYYNHIKREHFDQMQGTMAITGKTWCVYYVYATDSDMTYAETIPFLPEYWVNELYPALKYFIAKWKG